MFKAGRITPEMVQHYIKLNQLQTSGARRLFVANLPDNDLLGLYEFCYRSRSRRGQDSELLRIYIREIADVIGSRAVQLLKQ